MRKLEKLLEESQIELSEDILNIVLSNTTCIKIPSKTESKLKYISKTDLHSIHKDQVIATELILYMLSNFSDTFIISKSEGITEQQRNGYKILNSKVLSKQFKLGKFNLYKKIIDVLVKYEIIEKGRNYSSNFRSNEYRLTSTYFGKGVVNYKLKSNILLKRNSDFLAENFKKILDCPIATYELINRPLLEFPSKRQAKSHLQKLSNLGKTNKKGKKIISIKDKSQHDYEDYVYIEDYLEILDYLKNLTVPIIISENGGNRIITSFNFMPSVLRELIKVNGKKLIDIDYKTLHPNIIYTVYESKSKDSVSHDIVAEYLGITRQEAKIEHLSFFNKTWEQMSKSPLFKYYTDKEPDMMVRIFRDKQEFGHKETSKKCFMFETMIQRENVKKLKDKGIISFYCFDANFVLNTDKKHTKKIMNETVKLMKVNTTVN